MLSDKLSFFSERVQKELFPILENELPDPLLDAHRKVAQTLEVIQIERFITSHIPFCKGRPPHSRSYIARAFIAKHVLNICSTRHLIHMLIVDKNLRYICGWQPGERIPSESTFSRFFSEISETNILEKVHEVVLKDLFEEELVLHCGRDSFPVSVREREDREQVKKAKNARKRYPQRDEKGRKLTAVEHQALLSTNLQEMIMHLPKQCDIGKKTDPQGISKCWRGYKLHMDIADGRFPLSCILTSASTHDSQVAIPLSTISSSRATVLYELMDSAYDVNAIRGYVVDAGRVPLIKKHKRRGQRKELIEKNETAHHVLNWRPTDEVRLQHRMCNERLFARLSNSFVASHIWVRKHSKVMCHVMFGVLSLLASEILHS